jgi:archaellum component FlaC
METTVSEKSTKAEILKAYETLLKDVQKSKSNIPKQVHEEKQKTEILEKVSGITNDNIVNGIVELKSNLSNSLDDIQKSLTGEFKKLEEIRAAIALEKKTLEDLYSLSTNTDSLAAMLLTQKEKKEHFEKNMKEIENSFANDMAEKKVQWELEKTKQKVEEKEYSENLTKRRKREEEEYSYNLKIKRQKEQDDYDNRKSQLEKELVDKKTSFDQEISHREMSLKSAEAELAELRKSNAEFPSKLEKALKDKETEVTKQLQAKYNFDIKLTEKQNEADIRLKEQIIVSLQEKIKEQQEQLKEYADKVNRAEANVKDIAVKAIENASKIRMFTSKSDKEDN